MSITRTIFYIIGIPGQVRFMIIKALKSKCPSLYSILLIWG